MIKVHDILAVGTVIPHIHVCCWSATPVEPRDTEPSAANHATLLSSLASMHGSWLARQRNIISPYVPPYGGAAGACVRLSVDSVHACHVHYPPPPSSNQSALPIKVFFFLLWSSPSQIPIGSWQQPKEVIYVVPANGTTGEYSNHRMQPQSTSLCLVSLLDLNINLWVWVRANCPFRLGLGGVVITRTRSTNNISLETWPWQTEGKRLPCRLCSFALIWLLFISPTDKACDPFSRLMLMTTCPEGMLCDIHSA